MPMRAAIMALATIMLTIPARADTLDEELRRIAHWCGTLVSAPSRDARHLELEERIPHFGYRGHRVGYIVVHLVQGFSVNRSFL